MSDDRTGRRTGGTTSRRLASRAKGPALVVGAILIVLAIQLDQGLGALYFAGLALVLGSVALWFLPAPASPVADPEHPILVAPPFRGRWLAVNSPASKVPSHGTHHLAQTYAIDLIEHPEGSPPRRMTWIWPIARRPESFGSFGQPLLSPFDGVVVAVADGSRDHLSRTSLLGLAYLIGESTIRGLGRPGLLLGNHVLVEQSDTGHVALLAHARRGSIRVGVGDQVTQGQVLAECGNSGNSSEPHLHFQLMDGSDPEIAAGLPFAWPGNDGGTVPATDDTYTAGA